MKVLIVSEYGESTVLAYRLKNEGHEVKLFIEYHEYEKEGEGIVERVKEWLPFIDWATFIVFDTTKYGECAQFLRNKGYLVIGGNPYTDKLEDDRSFAQKEMKSVGLTALESKKFTDFTSAIEFVQNSPKRYVVKLNGTAADNKETTYVGLEEDGSDMIATLQHYQETLKGQVDNFEMQEFIDGVEMGLAGAFNGEDFVEPIEINFEHKKFATGNLGPNTGEMGTSMLFVSKQHPLYKQTIAKMIPKLQGYHGMFDINFMWTKDAAYPLEPTPRFGYPAIALQLESIASDYGERLLAIASGKDPKSKINHQFGVVALGVVPPFPFETKEIFDRISKDNLVIVKDPDKKGIHPVGVYEEKGQWKIATPSGNPILVTALGRTMKEAQQIMYSRLNNVHTPNLFYRTDIGDRWVDDYPRLKEWGWL